MKDPKVVLKKFKNKNQVPRFRIQCSCGCKERLDIYPLFTATEINGVVADNRFWKSLFQKVLKNKRIPAQ